MPSKSKKRPVKVYATDGRTIIRNISAEQGVQLHAQKKLTRLVDAQGQLVGYKVAS